MFPRIYKEFKPTNHLAHYIKCYWLFEKTYTSGEFEHVFPDSSYELVYEQKALYRVNDQELPPLYIVGQLHKPLDFYTTGTVRQWAVRFYPWGLQPFANIEAIKQREWMPANEILDTDTQELEQIMRRTDDQTVISKLDDYFMRHLLTWQFTDRVLAQAFETLKKQKGAIKIKDLAEYCFVSRRQLGRKITYVTGQSPHDIASRLRFEKVRDDIMHNPDTPLTFLAHHYGYTDQSHLIKEFRQYMEMTPSHYANQARAQQPRMKNRKNVLFLQLEKPTDS
jgi:AraC-like DNA-binding protein